MTDNGLHRHPASCSSVNTADFFYLYFILFFLAQQWAISSLRDIKKSWLGLFPSGWTVVNFRRVDWQLKDQYCWLKTCEIHFEFKCQKIDNIDAMAILSHVTVKINLYCVFWIVWVASGTVVSAAAIKKKTGFNVRFWAWDISVLTLRSLPVSVGSLQVLPLPPTIQLRQTELNWERLTVRRWVQVVCLSLALQWASDLSLGHHSWDRLQQTASKPEILRWMSECWTKQ